MISRQEQDFRKHFSDYFRDSDVLKVSKQSFVARVLSKWTTNDIKKLHTYYSFEGVQHIVFGLLKHNRPVFPPNLVALFTLRYHIPHDLAQRAMTQSKSNDFFSSRV
jgi:hypothetical protein